MKKKIIFGIILFILVLLFVEAGSFLSYLVIKGKLFPYLKYFDAMQVVSENDSKKGTSDRKYGSTEMKWGKKVEVIHPYLGYVQDPDRNSNVSDLGFPGKNISINSKSDDKLIVAILGGSFAMGTYRDAKEKIVEILKKTGKDIKIINLAAGGYKQPQQLFALTYLLCLGAEFDVVINLDGFNEVSLPPVENVSRNISPVYPRGWYFRVAEINSPQTLMKLGKIAGINENRKNCAKLFTKAKLFYSSALCTAWRTYDTLLTRKKTSLILTLEKNRKKINNEYVVTGPFNKFQNDDELYNYLATIWKQCSLQLNQICKANDIKYYHFLQPNQYIKDSKPMGKEELKIAISENQPYRKSVEKGYPIIMKLGKELINSKVKFYDLTMIFAENNSLLYRDDACHVNKSGYEIIATYIANTIEKDLSASKIH